MERSKRTAFMGCLCQESLRDSVRAVAAAEGKSVSLALAEAAAAWVASKSHGMDRDGASG
jgi:hypothetical protein